MKQTILLFAFALLSVIGSAQTDPTPSKYVTGMEKQLVTLDTAFTPSTLQKSYNSLERIANAEKTEWLPNYYMAYCLVMQAYQVETSQVDSYCDRANLLLDRADSLNGDVSEIYVMRAMVAGARINVDPRTRGAKYGKMSGAFLDSAEVHNPANPRITLTRGQALFYTPPMFGGGKAKAKPLLEESVKKYEAFVPASSIAPHWGKNRATQLLADCNKK
ncbi:hypothetical protein BH11BAC7_BH11BAC7_10820 [soil metagenome]